MNHDKVQGLGDSMGKRAGFMTDLSGKTKAINMHMLTFGVIGGGLNVVHDQVRDGAADALEKAREVLESWKVALSSAAKNAKEAEKAGEGGGDPEETPPGGGGPSFDPSKLGGLGAGETPSFDPELGGLDNELPGSGDLPETPGIDDLSKPPGIDDLPETPGLGQGQDGTGAAGNVNPPDLNGLDQNTPGTGTLEDPLRTQLAGYDPKTAVADALSNTPRMPGTTDLRSPGLEGLSAGQRGLDGGSGTGGGTYAGGAAGGANAGGLTGQGAGLGRGLGSSGMPMMPMAPMAGGVGGEGDKDRERSTWLAVEEDIWGGDGDVAPSVIE
ncbi:hypothetical protein AB0K21_39890 [Streptosporangium sp. NPDC049248]|uniref:hypothetical protein n=1 Tax=Streptosporangium sp. NPDC049248 TaxID=3155651 RepID=UPI00342835B3